MKTYLAILALAVGFAAAPANAVVYSFSTTESFAGGPLGFSFETPAPVTDTSFIERAALTNVVGSIQRVRFEASCPFGGGAAACDQVTVIAGTTANSVGVYRYFSNGAFAGTGSYAATMGAAASLTVTPSLVASVPEPATWAMMIAGLGTAGAGLRRRRKAPALA